MAIVVKILVIASLTAGCAATSTFSTAVAPRQAQNAPTRFMNQDGSVGAEDACVSPLIDPRDQTQLRMVRSGPVGGTHHGDYAVPEGRYGVGSSELLRIDCSTGQAIGIVRG